MALPRIRARIVKVAASLFVIEFCKSTLNTFAANGKNIKCRFTNSSERIIIGFIKMP